MEEEYTPDPNGCCETSRRERIAAGVPLYKSGTVGYLHGMPAVVDYDVGTACGGGDDILCWVFYQNDDMVEGWQDGWWAGAYEFQPAMITEDIE
jgi:hypothetical protein